MTLAEKIGPCIARLAGRRADGAVLGFETAKNRRFACVRRRYLGASGSTDPWDLCGSLPPTAFTMPIQTAPA